MDDYFSYYVEKLENPHVSRLFTRFLLSQSDAFSLIYFRFKENEPLRKSTALIKSGLAPYKIDSREVMEWPGTKILSNERGQIYRMVTYRSDINVLPIIEKVPTLWDWCYSKYPMDPCFYQNGYAWFESCTHELYNTLFLKKGLEYPTKAFIESLGVKLSDENTVPASRLFYNKYKES